MTKKAILGALAAISIVTSLLAGCVDDPNLAAKSPQRERVSRDR